MPSVGAIPRASLRSTELRASCRDRVHGDVPVRWVLHLAQSMRSMRSAELCVMFVIDPARDPEADLVYRTLPPPAGDPTSALGGQRPSAEGLKSTRSCLSRFTKSSTGSELLHLRTFVSPLNVPAQRRPACGASAGAPRWAKSSGAETMAEPSGSSQDRPHPWPWECADRSRQLHAAWRQARRLCPAQRRDTDHRMPSRGPRRSARRCSGRCHEGHLEGIAQSRDGLFDFPVVGYQQMETRREMDSWVDRGRGRDDLVDARMRATHTITMPSGVLMASEAPQFLRAGLVGGERDQMEAGVISVVLSINSNFAPGQAAPNRITVGGAPS